MFVMIINIVNNDDSVTLSIHTRAGGFDKSLYVHTYIREKLVVVEKYFIASRLSWDSNTVYIILLIWHLIFIMFQSKQVKK